MPRSRSTLVYVGIKHHVIALDQATGAEVWRTKLEGMRMRSHDFVHLHRDVKHLYAGCSGEIYALDPRTGAVRWHNQLERLGTGLASILSAASAHGDSPLTLFEEQRRRDAARSASAAAT